MTKKSKSRILKIIKNKRISDDPPPEPVPGTTWTMKQVSKTASNATKDGTGFQFGFPTYSQIIYPGKSARVMTGWKVKDLPDQTLLHTIPHRQLLNYGIVTFPQVIDTSKIGTQIVQTILNNNPYPIAIEKKNNESHVSIHRYCMFRKRKIDQMLKFDAGQFVSGLLGAATKILPLFDMF